MGKDHRVTLHRRHAFRTLSNKVKTIRTPGTIFPILVIFFDLMFFIQVENMLLNILRNPVKEFFVVIAIFLFQE